MFLTLLGILSFVGMAHQAPARSAQPIRPAGLIVGQVVDAGTGRPVPNAIVTMGGRARPRILTGGDGRFVFRDLPGGAFGVSAVKAGYTPSGYGVRRPGGPSQQITLSHNERLGDVTIRMWKQAAVSGKVLDETGEPVIGTRIRAFRRGGLPDPQRLNDIASATTDDRGVYRLGLLDAGEYIVGVVSRSVVVPVSLALQLRSGGSMAVRPEILGASTPGTPGGVQIGDSAVALGGGAPIPPPPEGQGTLVYPPSFFPSVSDPQRAVPIVLTAGEDRDGVDLQIRPVPTVRVSGTLTGVPASAVNVPVRLVPANGTDVVIDGDLPGTVTVTDRSGAFTFEAVPSGDYLLRATTRLRFAQGDPGDMQFAEIPITIEQSNIDGLAVALRPGLRISGSLQFEGASPRPMGMTDVRLSIEPAGGSLAAPMPSSTPRPTPDGEFEAAGLPPGRYYVRVSGSPRGWMFKSATVNGRDVADTAIELRDGDATGVAILFSDRWSGLAGVVTSRTGGVDGDALVIVFPTDPQTWNSTGFIPRRIKSARPSKTGQYGFPTLPPGQYYVAAVPEEQAADWRHPRFLEAASRGAIQVTIGDGERKTQDIRVREVR